MLVRRRCAPPARTGYWQVVPDFGRLLLPEQRIEQSLQLGLLLSSTGIVGSVLGELCEFVCQDARGYVLRKVDRVPRRDQLPTFAVAATQRPSLPFRTLVDLRLTSRERNQIVDLNLDPAPVPRDVHFLDFEMVEHNQRLNRLEQVTPTEARL